MSSKHPNDTGLFKGKKTVFETFAPELFFFTEVNFIPFKLQQLGVNDTQARLAASLGGKTGNQISSQYINRLVAANQLGSFQVMRVFNLRNNVVFALLPAFAIGK